MKNFCLEPNEIKKIDIELNKNIRYVNLNMSEQITGCDGCNFNCDEKCIAGCDGSCISDCSGEDYYSPWR